MPSYYNDCPPSARSSAVRALRVLPAAMDCLGRLTQYRREFLQHQTPHPQQPRMSLSSVKVVSAPDQMCLLVRDLSSANPDIFNQHLRTRVALQGPWACRCFFSCSLGYVEWPGIEIQFHPVWCCRCMSTTTCDYLPGVVKGQTACNPLIRCRSHAATSALSCRVVSVPEIHTDVIVRLKRIGNPRLHDVHSTRLPAANVTSPKTDPNIIHLRVTTHFQAPRTRIDSHCHLFPSTAGR